MDTPSYLESCIQSQDFISFSNETLKHIIALESGTFSNKKKNVDIFLIMPPPFSIGVHIVSLLSVGPSVPYVTLLVSVRYLLKGLVYWIEMLYTGI